MQRDISIPNKMRGLLVKCFCESPSKRVIGERYFPAVRADDVGKSLLDFISLHGAEQLAESLTLLHDWILYDSNLNIDQHRKDVLHDAQRLAHKLRQLKDD